MSSSAISTQVAQLKIGNVQNQADTSAVYNGGIWSFKNSTALTSVTITDAGNVGIGTASPNGALGIARAAGVSAYVEIAGNGNTPGSSSVVIGQDGASTGYVWNRANAWLNFGTNGASRGGISNQGGWYIGPTSASTLAHRISGTTLYFSSMADPTNNGSLSWPNGGNSQSSPVQLQSFGDNSSISIKAGESANTFAIVNLVGNWNGSSTTGGKIDCIAGTGGVRLSAGGTSWGAISDERKKKNIKPLEYGLAEVSAIKPVRFDYIVDESDASSRIGFTAQNLMPLVKESVQGTEDTEFTVTPADLVPVLVKAIQELSAKVDAQAAEIEALKAK